MRHVQLELRPGPGPGMIMQNLLFTGNTGEVYESRLAQLHAGKDVSPVPIFSGLSSDVRVTLLTKKLGGHPIICES